MDLKQIAIDKRKTTYDVDPLIVGRWSPRAMSGEPLDDGTLMSLFEAARWAPSSFNNQPWRFIVAKRDTPEWEKLFSLMVEFNQQWTKNAAALVVVVSGNNFEYNGKPSRTHSYDTGAATHGLGTEAIARNLVCHEMEGFDYDKAKEMLNIPDDYTVESMIAIGKPAPKDVLPEAAQEKEVPSDRKPLKELVFHGEFGKPMLE